MNIFSVFWGGDWDIHAWRARVRVRACAFLYARMCRWICADTLENVDRASITIIIYFNIILIVYVQIVADFGVRYDKSTGADGDRVVEAMLRWCAARRGGGALQPQRVCACVSGASYLRLIISDITR